MTITNGTHADLELDPIMVEIFRTRVEAICVEAGAAIENTAISPIVTETKDYAVTLMHADGTFLGGSAAVSGQFGVAMHAVSGTLARHRDSIADGDVFVANDPHSDGGFHPQDVVVQRPVYLDGQLLAWVAISAHMLDMGGMVPGSSCTQATECYQEALRFPSVRLFRQGVECEDMWEVLRTNLRSFDMIEMDMRSLVIGSHVAGEKVRALAKEVGVPSFRRWSKQLDAITAAEFRNRISVLEPGSYTTTAFSEVGDELYQFPCTLRIENAEMTFDLRDAPPQVPHFVNSKPYIIQAGLVPSLLGLLAPDLPLTQSAYDSIKLLTTPGTILDSQPPAPIGAAHMDCTIAVNSAAAQCILLASAASPKSTTPRTGTLYDAQGTTRWSFLRDSGHRTLFTLLDGVAGGSPAGIDRDGIDMTRDIAVRRSSLYMADVEVTESVYRVLYHSRGAGVRAAGEGRQRSGSGCRTVLGPHGVDLLEGNMTGTRGWFPCAGMAGGRPGARMSFRVLRADGSAEQLGMHDTGVVLREGDRFELSAASGGGYGDPIDREPMLVTSDHAAGRATDDTARRVYGVVLAVDGKVDELATKYLRTSMLRGRLESAASPVSPATSAVELSDDEQPLFPGVVQRGRYAVSIRSGALLSEAPNHWTDGSPVFEERYDSPGPVPLVMRSYLDPLTGHALHTELVPEGAPRSFATLPDRWTNCAHSPTQGRETSPG